MTRSSSATSFRCCSSRSEEGDLSPPCRCKSSGLPTDAANGTGKVFFASQTGISKALADRLFHRFLLYRPKLGSLDLVLADPRTYEPEDVSKESLLIIVASTWEGGGPPENARFLFRWLEESAQDFRVGFTLLCTCRFAVFGVGSSSYGEAFNAVAKDFSRWLKVVGAVELMPLCLGDQDGGDLDDVFDHWAERLLDRLRDKDSEHLKLKEGCSPSEIEGYESFPEEDEGHGDEPSTLVDLEDIAGADPTTPWTESRRNGKSTRMNSKAKSESNNLIPSPSSIVRDGQASGAKEMVTPIIRASLEKQMDQVTTSRPWWLLQTLLLWDRVSQLRRLFSTGVKQEPLLEGLTPRHCALSLVGEPIMYPEINVLIDELHRRHISTFLVTNAQFPERIRVLKPITQLYVSVDAATKETLKAIDRPLFGDFWERFLSSLEALREKEQRTVYRLTLVKGWNTEDIDAYLNLFHVGRPDLVEIKGLTYCGSSATSKLTMENVPWHADVRAFSGALAEKSGGLYEVACEHFQSCCVLLAKVDKFKVQGQWFTWIDYEKFQELVASEKPFTSKDYMAATPAWAVYGAKEGGFDPEQARYKKERHHREHL